MYKDNSSIENSVNVSRVGEENALELPRYLNKSVHYKQKENKKLMNIGKMLLEK